MQITRVLALAAVAHTFSGPPRKPPRSPRYAAGDGEDPDEGMRLGRGASTVATFGLGLASPRLVKSLGKEKAPVANAVAVSDAPARRTDSVDFSGTWQLAKSENMDDYLKSLNVSAVHRRIARGAWITHEIEHPSKDELKICVVNKLGRKCENVKVGEPVESTDTYGKPVSKLATWDADALRVATDSTVGRVSERRFMRGDAMVMELTSPAGVTAYRIFSRPAAAPAVRGGAAKAVNVVHVVFACTTTGFVLGRMSKRES
mmetsp:Transcript_18016/g.53574  ORF Transcript_18016/g.53574 Transcript_18016/m.53574 type:complete len:260 (-) Transcript_18016:35-814(-)